MHNTSTLIEDTFAEAFPMWACRAIVTAETLELARLAVQTAAGLATSIIGCGCEAGAGMPINPEDTPDGRPGQALLLFSPSKEKLADELILRIGQAVLPTATTACYNGLDGSITCQVGAKLRYFGDGYQSSKYLAGKRYWRIPVADGEFVIEETFHLAEGVGGGNLILAGTPRAAVFQAARSAVQAILIMGDVVAPFPGGVCRSPSKVGSRYQTVRASTNHLYCPTLISRSETRLQPGEEAAYEIVFDGLTEQAVAEAMDRGIKAACSEGVQRITAGNYGGKLGPYQFHLRRLMSGDKLCG